MLPAAPRPRLLARLAAIEAELGLAGDAVLRLAALAVEMPEDADRLRDRLRLSNEEHARLVTRGACARPTSVRARRRRVARACLYADGAAAYRERVLMAWARSRRAPAEPRPGATDSRCPSAGSRRAFPSAAPTSWRSALPAGPRVGELLRALEAWWVAGDFAADELALRAELQRHGGAS